MASGVYERIYTYILYNNFQGLINVYYLPRNVMAGRQANLRFSSARVSALPPSLSFCRPIPRRRSRSPGRSAAEAVIKK